MVPAVKLCYCEALAYPRLRLIWGRCSPALFMFNTSKLHMGWETLSFSHLTALMFSQTKQYTGHLFCRRCETQQLRKRAFTVVWIIERSFISNQTSCDMKTCSFLTSLLIYKNKRVIFLHLQLFSVYMDKNIIIGSVSRITFFFNCFLFYFLSKIHFIHISHC